MSNEPKDASHYRPWFANPAGRISELENMLEFSKGEIESFRNKWIAEKHRAEQLQGRLLNLADSFAEQTSKAAGAREATSSIDERNYWLGVRMAYADAVAEVEGAGGDQ